MWQVVVAVLAFTAFVIFMAYKATIHRDSYPKIEKRLKSVEDSITFLRSIASALDSRCSNLHGYQDNLRRELQGLETSTEDRVSRIQNRANSIGETQNGINDRYRRVDARLTALESALGMQPDTLQRTWSVTAGGPEEQNLIDSHVQERVDRIREIHEENQERMIQERVIALQGRTPNNAEVPAVSTPKPKARVPVISNPPRRLVRFSFNHNAEPVPESQYSIPSEENIQSLRIRYCAEDCNSAFCQGCSLDTHANMNPYAEGIGYTESGLVLGYKCGACNQYQCNGECGPPF